jgi:aminoglycoside phosphotransferase (APT) family kinase protein
MPWSSETVCAALRTAGVALAPHEVTVEQREGRQLVRLPGDRLAWFADDEPSRRAMACERRVLQLIATRCSFAVPRVVFASADGAFDVRAAVPGLVDPATVFEKVSVDAALAWRMGAEIGAILAQQHTRITADDAAGWLPSRVAWPEPTTWIVERLPRVIGDEALLTGVCALLERYDAVPVTDADRTVVHGDVGFHNLALDPVTFAVRGVFDYENAAWADRHHDFRYLLFDTRHEEMLDAALSVYEPAVGRKLSRERIYLYNAASAASFLAFRDGVPSDRRWCGRTLAEDLAWTRDALTRATQPRPAAEGRLGAD